MASGAANLYIILLFIPKKYGLREWYTHSDEKVALYTFTVRNLKWDNIILNEYFLPLCL